MKRKLLAISVLAYAGLALAGAWDTGPFDNDDALDWVWELSESDDLSVIEIALRDAAASSSYLEAPTASIAVAAAEVVAALNGNPRAELPLEVSEWVMAHKADVDNELTGAARNAIVLVLNADSSELAQLWSDSDELAEVWTADLQDLLKRLE